MQGWRDFYELIGGAAATLLGLLFVSMSLNADIILGPAHQHSRRLAEQAFQNYICVMILSLLAVFREMSLRSFGDSLLLTIAVWTVWVAVRIFQAMTIVSAGESRIQSLRRYLMTALGFGMLIYSGLHMRVNQDESTFTAIGTMLLLVSASAISWELLIRVAAEKYAARKD